MNRSIFILLALVSASPVQADFVAYQATREVSANSGTLTFRHFHHWGSSKLYPLFSDITHHERFFSAANDFAFVELRDGNKVLFRSPSPALTHLWISPDAQIFVGLSNIMLSNPYQLVVWRRDGTLLHREHISAQVAKLTQEQRQDFAKRFPKDEQLLSGWYFTHGGATYLDHSLVGGRMGDEAWKFLAPLQVPHPYSDDFGESVSNFVYWFDQENPDIRLSRTDWRLSLSLRSPTGKRFSILLKQ